MTKRIKAAVRVMALCLILVVVSASSMGCKKSDPAGEPNRQRTEQDFSKPGNEGKDNDISSDNSVSFGDITGTEENGSEDKKGSDSISEQGQSEQMTENQVGFQVPGGNDGNTSSDSQAPLQSEQPENPEQPGNSGDSGEPENPERPEDPGSEKSGWTRYY